MDPGYKENACLCPTFTFTFRNPDGNGKSFVAGYTANDSGEKREPWLISAGYME